MIFSFAAEAIEWRGPAPFVFVPTPSEIAEQIREVASLFTYGWGVIPVRVTIGETEFTTALFPRNGVYLVPVKVAVQRAEGVHVGDLVPITVELGLDQHVSP